MCIMATVSARAQSTRIFAIPVTYRCGADADADADADAYPEEREDAGDKDRKYYGSEWSLRSYDMDSADELDAGTISNRGTAIVYVNTLRMADAKAKPQLMIVPFPNPGGEAALASIILTPYEPWRTVANVIMDVFRDDDSGAGFFGPSGGPPVKRAVHRVGNYICSVVPDVSTLLTTVDWSAFDVAPDLERRLSVLHDPRVCPRGCGFVVAQAVSAVAEDGFAVIYPGTDIMLPTCHEIDATDPLDSTTTEYDVACYVVGVKPKWRGALQNTSRFHRSRSARNALRATRNVPGITALDATPARVSVIPLPKRAVGLGRLQLYGADVNANVFVSGSGAFNPSNPELQMDPEAVTLARRARKLAHDDSEEEW